LALSGEDSQWGVMQSPDFPTAARTEPSFALSRRELVIMLALTQAFQALAIDSVLPGLGELSRDLKAADPNQGQLVVGLFLIGIGLGALLPGPLADRFGRKPVLLTSVLASSAITLVCMLIQTIDQMLVLRFLGGLIYAGLAVVPPAIIRDRFEGDRMASLQSMIGVIFLVVPMVAPSVGQLILLFVGWRWIFGFIALLGLAMTLWIALRLPETLDPSNRQRIDPRSIGRNIREIMTTRASFGYVLGGMVSVGVLWGYIQSSQQLVGDHFGAGRAFPLFFGGMALAMAVANLTNSRIVERFGARRVAHTALFVYIALALIQYHLAHRGAETLWQFVPMMTLTMMCMGFTGANFAAIALQPFARMAGAASSVQTFVRSSLGGLIAAFIGQAYDGSARPFSSALVVGGVMILLLILWSENGRLFRRLHPRGTQPPIA